MIPSLVAITLKLVIFWLGRHSLFQASRWLSVFFIGLLSMNLIELIGFYYIDKPQDAFGLLSAYYIFALTVMFSMLVLLLECINRLSRIVLYILYTTLIISITPLLIPGAALAGVESIGYAVTRVPGPYYFIVQLGLLVPLLASLVLALYFSVKGQSHRMLRRSQIFCMACAPLIITAVIIICLMQLGVKINAAVILSLSVTMTLGVFILTHSDQRAYQFMAALPWTREHRFIKRLASIVNHPDNNWKQGRGLIEQEMVQEALVLSDGNKEEAASLLGISRQTLVRRLEG